MFEQAQGEVVGSGSRVLRVQLLGGGGLRSCILVVLAGLLQSCGRTRDGQIDRSTPGEPRPFEVAWFKGGGSAATDLAFQISADSAERVFMVGASAGAIDWGQGPLTPEEGYAPFIVAMDGVGDPLFSKMARVSNNQTNLAVAADGVGGAVLAGVFGGRISSDTLDWGGLQLVAPTPGRTASFVVRLGSDGSATWGRVFAAGSPFAMPSIAVDSDGNVLWAGESAHGADFGSGPQSGSAFLVKLDSTGQPVWSKVFSTNVVESMLEPLGVAVDGSGNAVLLGHFSAPVDLGSGPLVPAEWGDVFVAKFDAAGNPLWSRAAGGWRGGAVEAGIAVGPDDEIAVTAPFSEAATFGASGRELGSGTVLFARLDADGEPSFIRRDGGVSGAALAIDGEGHVVVHGSGIPQGVPEPPLADYANFVVAYDANGELSRYLVLAGEGVYSQSVAVTESGSVFVTGRFGDELRVSDQALDGAGEFDCYVGRLER
jgi:hypothetical protein